MIAEILAAVYQFVDFFLLMYQVVIFLSIVMSWVGADPNNQLVQIIYTFTEPVLRPIRRLTHRIPGPFDWSPMFLLLGIHIFRIVLKHGMAGLIQVLR